MKKLFYTISFVALLSIAGKSQTDKPAAKQEPAKKETIQSAATTHDAAKDEKADQPKSTGTRMAINEKGVPASKAAKDKPAKEEKAVSPGQPAATDKK